MSQVRYDNKVSRQFSLLQDRGTLDTLRYHQVSELARVHAVRAALVQWGEAVALNCGAADWSNRAQLSGHVFVEEDFPFRAWFEKMAIGKTCEWGVTSYLMSKRLQNVTINITTI